MVNDPHPPVSHAARLAVPPIKPQRKREKTKLSNTGKLITLLKTCLSIAPPFLTPPQAISYVQNNPLGTLTGSSEWCFASLLHGRILVLTIIIMALHVGRQVLCTLLAGSWRCAKIILYAPVNLLGSLFSTEVSLCVLQELRIMHALPEVLSLCVWPQPLKENHPIISFNISQFCCTSVSPKVQVKFIFNFILTC